VKEKENIAGVVPTNPTTGGASMVAVVCPTSQGTPTLDDAPEHEKNPPTDADAAVDGPVAVRDVCVRLLEPPSDGHGTDACGAIEVANATNAEPNNVTTKLRIWGGIVTGRERANE
jgi:hypothetical protein